MKPNLNFFTIFFFHNLSICHIFFSEQTSILSGDPWQAGRRARVSGLCMRAHIRELEVNCWMMRANLMVSGLLDCH